MKRRVTIMYPPVSMSHRSGTRWDTTSNGYGGHSNTHTSSLSSSSSPLSSSSLPLSPCSSYSTTSSASEKHALMEDALNNNNNSCTGNSRTSSCNHVIWCNNGGVVHSSPNSGNQHDSENCNFNKNSSGHLPPGCGLTAAPSSSSSSSCNTSASSSNSCSSSVSSSSSSSSNNSGKHRSSSSSGRHGDADVDDWRVHFIVALIAVLCYLNGIQGDFVHDDIPAITMNKDVLGLSPISQVFRNDFWGTPMADLSSHKSYRPLTTLTFR